MEDMKEFIEYEGRHNVYYRLALIDSYDIYKNMSKKELLLAQVFAKKRNKEGLRHGFIADCVIIYELLKQKEETCLKD